MSRLIARSGCKINLGLRVLRRRTDGFHDIETVMYPVEGLHDIMEFVAVPGSAQLEFSTSGVAVDCPVEQHLCHQAWQLLHEAHGIGGGKFHIHKTVPTGAGLGGGSANAAAALRLFSEAFNLGLTVAQIARYGAQLGSDVPFFCQGEGGVQAKLAEGRGEILSPVQVDLAGHFLVILKPPVGVSTAEAYAGLTPYEGGERVAQTVARGVHKWRGTQCPQGVSGMLVNDFEASIFARYPILSELKALLYERGAQYAAMSGSGSAIFGIFAQTTDCTDLPYYTYSSDL